MLFRYFGLNAPRLVDAKAYRCQGLSVPRLAYSDLPVMQLVYVSGLIAA
jgi:hypothetical protein